MELRHAALHVWSLADPATKVAATLALGAWAVEGVEAKRAKTEYRRGAPTSPGLAPWAQEVIPGGAGFSRVAADDLLPPTLLAQDDTLTLDTDCALPHPASGPGRPPRPALVAFAALPRRSPGTPQGRAALLHAVVHIEFNAINLALDAVWRFAGMPADYYRDWLRVAAEEAVHFTLLADHLATLGHAYGDFDAHDGLWAMAERTTADACARMALVPCTLEARGLDATPAMQQRLRQAGDLRAVAILDLILREEIGHVAIGKRWFNWLCARDDHDPLTHYDLLAARHAAPRPKPPFNHAARRAAGFSEAEMAALAGQGIPATRR